MYPREMPNSFFSRLLERVYVRGVHNSDYPLEKIIMLGMTLLTPGLPLVAAAVDEPPTSFSALSKSLIKHSQERRREAPTNAASAHR